MVASAEQLSRLFGPGGTDLVVMESRGHFGCLERDGGVMEFVGIVMKAVEGMLGPVSQMKSRL